MNMNEFNQNNTRDGEVIQNPNLRNYNKDMSTQVKVDPVKDLGFKSDDQVAEEHAEPDDITKALTTDLMAAAERKKEEMQAFVDTLDQCGGEMTQEDYEMATGQNSFEEMLKNPPDPLNKDLKAYRDKRIAEIKETATPEELAAMGLAEPIEQAKSVQNSNIVQMQPTQQEETTSSDEEDAELMDEMNIGVAEVPADIATTVNNLASDKPVEKSDSIPTVDEVETVQATDKDNMNTGETNAKKATNALEEFNSFDDIDIDKELADLDQDDTDINAETESMYKNKIKNASNDIRTKVMPITDRFDISGFEISNRPVTIDNSVKMATSVKAERSARWALFASGRPIEMKQFMGTEIDDLHRVTPLRGENKTEEDLTISELMKRYKILYDHTISPKPETVEEWIKTISVMDKPHLFATALRASFDGVMFMPIDCINPQCNNGFITDSMDFNALIKYEDSEAKKAALDIYNSNPPESDYHLYHTKLVPISQVYAVSFKDPSIWDVDIAPKYLEPDWLERMQNTVAVSMYIDQIYVIDQTSKTLRPLSIKEWKNDPRKTLKSKVLALAKVLSTLTSDQYNLISAYINDITKPMSYVRYQLPETQCPKCKTTVPAIPYEPSRLLFTRHRVTSLVNG